MSDARFRRSAGGVTSLGLHVVWCPKYRSRLLRGQAEFPWLTRQKVLWPKSYFVASVGYVSEETVRRYIEHQWDDAA